MDIHELVSESFLSDVLSHQVDMIRLGRLKLVDPSSRALAAQERLAHKQALLEREMARAHLRNKKYSPLLST